MQDYTSTRFLIIAKTYPIPSANYNETTCVAAFEEQGDLRRIYPIPFRHLSGDQRFKKWEWISARAYVSSKDKRPESRKVDFDSIERTDLIIPSQNAWQERLKWVRPHLFNDLQALEDERQSTGRTLGFVRPNRLIELQVTEEKEEDWTEREQFKLTQDNLFTPEEVRERIPLRKVPFQFHYAYEVDIDGVTTSFRHKINDWEATALYWNCICSHGQRWEIPFRQKLETDFAEKDLCFLMGTIHRFPDQWLIVSLIYPPKGAFMPPAQEQLPLF